MDASASDNMAEWEITKEIDVIDMLCDSDADIKLTQFCDMFDSDNTSWPNPQVLENDEENVTLSQIADRIEKDSRDSEDMFGQFNDFSLFEDIAKNAYGDFDVNMANKEAEGDLPASDDERFGNVTSEDDLNELISENTPKNTKTQTKWASNRTAHGDLVPELPAFTVADVNTWLSRFIVEARKKNGDFYPPKSLYLLSIGLLRFNRDAGVNMNFMDESDDRFLRFRRILDSKMKMLTSKGYGLSTKQAEPLSQDDEMTLWKKGQIGYESSYALLNGVFFYDCRIFGMRGRDEHYNLDASQILIGHDQLEAPSPEPVFAHLVTSQHSQDWFQLTK